jgi:single-strand DNA-binding protein
VSGETVITLIGNLTADPDLRFTPSGVGAARFTIASTPRTFDKTTNQWVDGTAMFLPCTAWRDLAEHVAESLTRGMRVIVTGRLTQHNWQTPEGDKRSRLQLEVDEIGPSLRFANAKVTKAQRTATNGTTGGNGIGGPAAQGDPWATGTPAPVGAAAGAGWGSDEPPF